MTTKDLPVPRFDLADRVSPLGDKADPVAFYLEYGKRIHDDIVGLLPWPLEELQRSPSWRVTAPLRKLKRMFPRR